MKKTLITLSIVLALNACNSGGSNSAQDLDNRLISTINEAFASQNGRDYKALILPENDEFEAIPQDPLNPLTVEKVRLGKLLYHETGLARDPKNPQGFNTYSCASCHHAKAGFQAGSRQGIGEGGSGFGTAGEGRIKDESYDGSELDVQTIRSPSVLNTAYQEVMLWNGQFGATGLNAGTEAQWTPGTPIANNTLGFEGLETQAIAGIKVHRLKPDEEFAREHNYIKMFDDAFSDIPESERYNTIQAGKAIAAYERTLLANQSPFQLWLKDDFDAMTDRQKQGAELFFSKANCFSCHNNPALSSRSFHALGMGELRGEGIFQADMTEKTSLGRGSFTKNPADNYKFKTPQLYNLKDSPFLGHGGTFNSVQGVIEYKNNAVAQNTEIESSNLSPEFQPLNLTEDEILALTDFVENALHDPYLERYIPSEVQSGLCFPNNDDKSKQDLGCE